ncbi:MAG: CpXC domain-containing protein [Firmicutes bacterium]|nr:CpXC domain-containing protein [Bacillota bacterium]MCL2771273.1 CpXC domain-containing protein [Bacillota bacterium]
MSRIDKSEVACPKCQQKVEVMVYHSINVKLDPTLKEKLITREVFRNVCKCGEELNLMYDLMYHDMGNLRIIWLSHDEKNTPGILSLTGMWLASGYTLRVARNFNEMLEKIKIFDEGLNDAAIEFIKNLMYGEFAKSGEREIDIFFDGIHNGEFSFVIINEKGARQAQYGKKVYDANINLFENEYKDYAAKSNLFVNQQTLHAYFTKKLEEMK